MIVDAPRPRATSQGTRARLLAAAQTLFVESGYEATSVRSVAGRADVTIGAFYGHFGSKRNVLFEVVRAMNTVGRGGKLPFAKPSERALVLTIASFADSDDEAAVVLDEVLRVIAPGRRSGVDAAAAGQLLTNLLGSHSARTDPIVGPDGQNGAVDESPNPDWTLTTSVTRRFSFEASHQLPWHPGKCADLHGHSYVLDVTVENDLAPDGIVIDFADLKAAVTKYVLDDYDHRHLNEVLPNPTAELIAADIATRLLDGGVSVTKVTVAETASSSATVRVTRQ